MQNDVRFIIFHFYYALSFSNLITTSESQSVSAASSVQLYAGQGTECNLSLVNTSEASVESFDLELVHANRLSSNQVFSVR